MISRFAAVALCIATVAISPPAPRARPGARAPTRGTKLKVTGAGTGTLKPGPYADCLNNLVKKNGLTDVSGLMGKITGFSKGVASWSLEVSEKKIGKFKLSASPIFGSARHPPAEPDEHFRGTRRSSRRTPSIPRAGR